MKRKTLVIGAGAAAAAGLAYLLWERHAHAAANAWIPVADGAMTPGARYRLSTVPDSPVDPAKLKAGLEKDRTFSNVQVFTAGKSGESGIPFDWPENDRAAGRVRFEGTIATPYVLVLPPSVRVWRKGGPPPQIIAPASGTGSPTGNEVARAMGVR